MKEARSALKHFKLILFPLYRLSSMRKLLSAGGNGSLNIMRLVNDG